MRVLLIGLNTALAVGLELSVSAFGTTLTGLDLAGIAIAAGMVALLAVRVARNLRELAREEPAAARGGGL